MNVWEVMNISRELKARDKRVQKMSRDGATLENRATGETERISQRDTAPVLSQQQPEAQNLIQPQELLKSPLPLSHGTDAQNTGAAERVFDRIDTEHADVVDENGRGQLYFNGEPVCYFADNLATDGKFEGGVYYSGEGTSGVITERNADGELVGLKLLSESELKEYKWYYSE